MQLGLWHKSEPSSSPACGCSVFWKQTVARTGNWIPRLFIINSLHLSNVSREGMLLYLISSPEWCGCGQKLRPAQLFGRRKLRSAQKCRCISKNKTFHGVMFSPLPKKGGGWRFHPFLFSDSSPLDWEFSSISCMIFTIWHLEATPPHFPFLSSGNTAAFLCCFQSNMALISLKMTNNT